MPNDILLSVIIPVHNESKRIARGLEAVLEYLARQTFASEVLVVENGSSDDTVAQARQYATVFQVADIQYRILELPARGKGGAVKAGMLEAAGNYLLSTDVDMSVPMQMTDRFLDLMYFNTADIVIASREADGAKRVDEPFIRHLMGRIFNGFVQSILLPGIKDSQCGFKLYKREAARVLFQAQQMTGMSYDAENLYLARKCGYRIAEVPVIWTHADHSAVRPFWDSFEMAVDLLRVRLADMRGVYASIDKHKRQLSESVSAAAR